VPPYLSRSSASGGARHSQTCYPTHRRSALPPDHRPDHVYTRSAIEHTRTVLEHDLTPDVVQAIVENGSERPYPIALGDPLIIVEPFYEERYCRWELNKIEARLSVRLLRAAVEGPREPCKGKQGCTIM